MEKFQANGNQNTAEVAVLIAKKKKYFKLIMVTRDKRS